MAGDRGGVAGKRLAARPPFSLALACLLPAAVLAVACGGATSKPTTLGAPSTEKGAKLAQAGEANLVTIESAAAKKIVQVCYRAPFEKDGRTAEASRPARRGTSRRVGHDLRAFILKGDFDRARAAEFDLRAVRLPFGLTMFPVVDGFIDTWADRLGIHGSHPEPICNFLVVHHMMRSVAGSPLFAVIVTEYFGGHGGQAAAVYDGERVVLEPSTAEGSINRALRLLGVTRESDKDEFDSLGLRAFRDTRDCFGDGYDE